MNYANSFFKDIKANSSINQLGTKLKKNISDLKESDVKAPSWLPETKDLKEQFASAASQLTEAVNQTDMVPKTDGQEATSSPRTGHKRTVSSGNFESSSSANSSISSRHEDPVVVQDMSKTKRTNTPRSASVQHYQPDNDPETNKQFPQPGSINLRDSPRHRNESVETKRPSSSTGRRVQPMVPTQNQPETSSDSMVTIPKNPSANLTSTSHNEFYNNASNNNKTEQIDSLELHALRDTNDVLKSEVQRLSGLENKLKELEGSKKETISMSKYEADLKSLSSLKIKCEKLEAEIKHLKLSEDKAKMFQRNNDSNMERLEVENANLKNKIYDLDKLVEENELETNSLKIKEQSLEKQNSMLESEIDRLSDSKNDMSSLKINALEQANKSLEIELEQLKIDYSDFQKKSSQSNDSANVRQLEKIKSLEEHNISLQKQLEKLNSEQTDSLHFLDNQCDAYKSQIDKLKIHEKSNADLQKSLTKMKEELRVQSLTVIDERKKYADLKVEQLKLVKNIDELNSRLDKEQDTYEVKLNNLFKSLEKKDNEIAELKKSKDSEHKILVSKLQDLNEENLKMVAQLKNINTNSTTKDDDLNKLRSKINDLNTENEKLMKSFRDYENLENDLIDAQFSKDNATKRINDLEDKLRDWEQKYSKDINEYKSENQQQQFQLKLLKQQLTEETLKAENLNADCSLLKMESNKVESLKMKCEYLERELKDAKMTKERSNHNFHQFEVKQESTSENFESENKLLNNQIKNLRNDVRVLEQENKQLEKVIESERSKTLSYIKQVDDLNNQQTTQTMQNSEFKRRLVSLDLLTDECNQLRKNLTLMTIESESRKSEVTALNSQINILESTVKSLRDSSEKHSHLELNYENVSYELKKKQEDYKRLQQLHETVKKEQQDTIELLEEKLRDVEKKTEMQALKHEEIMLELELIRTRRDRLLPICPNCSSQTMAVYQPHQSQSQGQSGSQCPSPQQFTMTQQNPMYQQQSTPIPQYQSQVAQSHNQALLSIQIPQQPNYSSSIISPYQSHLGHPLQVIQLPGKQFVTVECQTSPTIEANNNILIATKKSIGESIVKPVAVTPEKHVLVKQKSIKKVNATSQTDDVVKKKLDNKEINTDRVIMRNQAITCNLCAENLGPAKAVCEDKGVQTNEVQLLSNKQKYFLYTCKYTYDPFKSSPNDNPEAELPLAIGEYLFILSEEDEDGFYMGETIASRRGLVPSNFIERVNIDQTNLQKYLTNLPKNLLLNPKFKECANLCSIDAGQIILAAQQLIQKAPAQKEKPETPSSAVTLPAVPTQQQQQQQSKNSLIPIAKYIDELSESTVKIGLPYPHNIKIEKRSDTSFVIRWEAPTAAISLNQSIDCDQNDASIDTCDPKIQSYNIYLNHEIYTMINATEETIALVEDVDLSVPNRVSIQAIANKDISSKPQECTLLFGTNRSFAPSGLSVYCLSQTSAIVSWWPSSSLFSHVISIDSIEHRTLKQGIYRFKLSGLLPDTSHLISVTAQITNHTNECSSNYTASVEFRTLPSRILSVPQDLTIEKDPVEPETYNLLWQPVVNMPNTVSNGIPIGGYSIYLDGARVHQILNPIASTVSLSQKLLFSGAKILTIRALSLDGNAESKDSEPLHLSKVLMTLNQNSSVPASIQETNSTVMTRKKTQLQPQQSPTSAQPVPQAQQPTNTNQLPNLSNNPLSALKNPLTSLFNSVNNEVNAFNENTKKQESKPAAHPQQATPTIVAPVEEKKILQPKTQPSQIQSSVNSSNINTVKKTAISNIPRVTDVKKAPKLDNRAHQNRSSIDNDADLYENNRGEPAPIKKTQQSQQQQQKSRQNSPITANSKYNNNSTPKKTNVKSSAKKESRIFMALFDYDPFKMSPNTDSCQEELPFKEGAFIKVFGDQDSDGYYYGELNGRLGYIPSNMVSEVRDQNVLRQLTAEQNASAGHHGSIESLSDTRSNKGGIKHNNQQNIASKTSKTTKTTSKLKEQSFQPINNYGNQYAQQSPQQQKPVHKNTMIALYDYDPQSLSPNVDVDVELPFKTGDVLTVIGEMDEDGFYMAELNGKRGLVPSNFLQPCDH